MDTYSVKLLVTKANSVLLKVSNACYDVSVVICGSLQNVEKSLLIFYQALLVKNSAQVYI